MQFSILSYHQLIIFTILTTTCKTPKNIFSCFSAVFVCFGNTINMLKIASNKLKQWGKFHYRTMERFIAEKGWSRQRGDVEGRWGVGAGLTAILTTIEMEKKMNEMCSPWWRWGRRRRRPDSRPLPTSHPPPLVPTPCCKCCHRCRCQRDCQAVVLSYLPPVPRPLLPACAAAPPVICIKNIIHCNRKDLHKNILQCGPAA